MGKCKLMFSVDDPLSKSRCMQNFAKEADVNNIMQKFKQTGFLVDPLMQPQRKPYFGDFSNSLDFMAMRNKVNEGLDRFNLLPAEVRSKFDHDVSKLLDFVNDPKNADEARKLGILPPLTREEMKAKENPPKLDEKGEPVKPAA